VCVCAQLSQESGHIFSKDRNSMFSSGKDFYFLFLIVKLTASIKSVLSDCMSRLSLGDQATSYALNIRDVIPVGTVAKCTATSHLHSAAYIYIYIYDVVIT